MYKRQPKVLLLDEPLAALDLKLCKDMQVELKNIQKSLGITFIYVTHDQEEALSMSDTVVVMDGGEIQQIGTPQDIYNEPKNAFVADFIGESNILDGVMHEMCIRDRLWDGWGTGAALSCSKRSRISRRLSSWKSGGLGGEMILAG